MLPASPFPFVKVGNEMTVMALDFLNLAENLGQIDSSTRGAQLVPSGKASHDLLEDLSTQ